MTDLFLKILNLCLSASWIVLAVLVLHPLLHKAPRRYSAALWGVVGLRLLLPFSLKSLFSLQPSAEPVPHGVITGQPRIDSGIQVLDDAVEDLLTSAASGHNVSAFLGNGLQALSVLWLAGFLLMLGYMCVSFLRLDRQTRVGMELRPGIRICDGISSPFILGIFHPVICLPSSLSEKEQDFVVAHEEAHIRRRDHLWKPLGFLLLSVYWFNPLLWIAYAVLCRDIEVSCDEKVLDMLGEKTRREYSRILLDCSIHGGNLSSCPVAFAEVGIKERIRNIMNYRKPAFWITAVAILAIVVLALCFLTDPTEDDPSGKTTFRVNGTDYPISTRTLSVDSAWDLSGLTDATGLRFLEVKQSGSDASWAAYLPSGLESLLIRTDAPLQEPLLFSGLHVRDLTIDLTNEADAISLNGTCNFLQVSGAPVGTLDCGALCAEEIWLADCDIGRLLLPEKAGHLQIESCSIGSVRAAELSSADIFGPGNSVLYISGLSGAPADFSGPRWQLELAADRAETLTLVSPPLSDMDGLTFRCVTQLVTDESVISDPAFPEHFPLLRDLTIYFFREEVAGFDPGPNTLEETDLPALRKALGISGSSFLQDLLKTGGILRVYVSPSGLIK